MKMISAGSANILNYAPYSRNCNLGNTGRRYLAPVPSLADVQLFVNFGSVRPTSFEFTIIDICHPARSGVLTPGCYVVGWNGSYWYGVFKQFSSTEAYDSFIIAMTTGSKTFFSEQYQVETECDTLTKISVCYPSNYNSEDVNGIYIGLPDTSQPYSGRPSVFYHHNFWTRQGEIVEMSNKITFTSNAKKNFASSLTKLFEFRPELVPGWYKDYLLSVYFRGDILINGTHTLVTDLAFEDVDVDYWKPYAVLGKEVKGGFGCAPFVCDENDCAPEVCVPVSFVPPTFPDAIAGYPYSKDIFLSGTGPFSVYGTEGLPAWMEASISGATLTLSGTPTSADAGQGVINFSVMNSCGDQSVTEGSIVVTEEPPVVQIGGTVLGTTRSVVVNISQSIPCDVTLGIRGTYDQDGVPTEFFVNVTIPAGSTSKTQSVAIDHYVISCIKPTTAGGTTYETSRICGEINYQFILQISNPC